MKTEKVYIVDGDGSYFDMFKAAGFGFTNNVEEASLIQFTGGSDVSPSLYLQENTNSYCDSNRDLWEVGVFLQALRLGKPMAGICRGGQFLNVMCGGKMIQDVPNHTRSHQADIDGQIISVTSTHHQMMVPGPRGSVIGTASLNSKGGDIEAVFYGWERCLCFQPHPEFDPVGKLAKVYFNLLSKYLNVNP